MLKKISLFIIAVIAMKFSSAQTFYDINNIQKIEIYFSDPSWDYKMDTAKHGDEGYTMADWVKINGVLFDTVGVKYKGNSSFDSTKMKNPLHIELDQYKNQNYQGYKDIKLSNGYGDPSFIREVLAYKILGNYMHCPLSNFAQVYINGVYYGIYSSAENIDKKFCGDHFYSSNGTFFKCNPLNNPGPTTKSNFKYLGTDTTLYEAFYELKSKTGWQDLVKLCDSVTNNTGSYDNMLDIDRIIWMLAFNNTFVNLDSYSGVFAQNHYIYRDKTNHYNPVIWDLNMCFGAFPFAGVGNTSMGNLTPATMQQFSPANHATDDYWPLIKAIQANDSHRKKYIAHMKTLLSEVVSNNWYNSLCTQFRNLIDTAVQSDSYKKYTYAQFQSAMNTDIVNGSYTIPGISNLLNGRAAHLLALPEFTAAAPAISNITASNPSPNFGTTVVINATMSSTNTAYMGYRFDKTLKFQKTIMYDDGAHNDGAAADGVYGVDVVMNGANMQYYIYAENNDAGTFSPARAEHDYYNLTVANISPVPNSIVINEILADNKNNVIDEYNDNEDWIEIYNTTNQTIDLSNVYLSDNKTMPLKWKFPANTYITPNGYITVFADDDSLEQVLHTNFNISKDTGFVSMSFGATLLDSISFTAQMSDTSFGRYPNGSGGFQIMNTTYGYENNNFPLSANDFAKQNHSLNIYPNPADANITVVYSGTKTISVYDVFGKKIISIIAKDKALIDTKNLAEGIYILKCENESQKFIIKH